MHVALLVCTIEYVKNFALTQALGCACVNAVHLCASGSPVCMISKAITQQVMGPPRGLQHPPRFRDRFPLVQTLSGCGDERNNQLLLEDTNRDTWTVIVKVWLCSARRRRSTNSETRILAMMSWMNYARRRSPTCYWCGRRSTVVLVSRSFDCIKFVCSLSFLNST